MGTYRGNFDFGTWWVIYEPSSCILDPFLLSCSMFVSLDSFLHLNLIVYYFRLADKEETLDLHFDSS